MASFEEMDKTYEILDQFIIDDQNIICSYANNAWTGELVDFLDNQEELKRLNIHRKENRNMQSFNKIVKAAIKLRHINERR